MRKIPTVLGLILVVGLVGILALTTSSLQRVTTLFSKADVGQTLILPPATANISDTSFSVYWITAAPGTGAINYGSTTALENGLAIDDRNATTHLVRVTGLKPATKYYYRLSTSNLSETPQEVTTGTAAVVALNPIFGKVLDSTNQTLEGAIVVWQGKTAALSKTDGSFVLPVYGINLGESEQIVVNADSGSATVSCTYGHDQPLPAIKLGDNVNCDSQTAGTQVGFTVPKTTNNPAGVGGQLQVNLQDKENVSTPLPTIDGKAGPNQVVNIVVHSAIPYSGTVMADRDGNWSWTPPANLTPGDHTATITITNPDGTTQTITRQFTVIAGEPILPITSGTPSANPTHKACVNNACTNVAGAGADACLSDTDCAPPPPPISTISAAPVTPPPTPATGAFENTLILILGGFALVALGIGLLF